MLGRIVEIAEPGRYLGLKNGFLNINQDHQLIAQIPLDDILALIFCGQGNSISTNLIQALSQHNAIILFTDSTYHPANILWPIYNHSDYITRLNAQIIMSSVLKKQLWKDIICLKLLNQQTVLQSCVNNNFEFNKSIISVKTGDKTNREAVAAKHYWTTLFGKDFKRSDSLNPINGFLNYGYAILRAMMARYTAISGLNASLGIHHHNKLNIFCLIDDLMEPYRPFIDQTVYLLFKDRNTELTPYVKKQLVSLFYNEYICDKKKRTLTHCIQKTVYSYITSLETKTISIKYPKPLLHK